MLKLFLLLGVCNWKHLYAPDLKDKSKCFSLICPPSPFLSSPALTATYNLKTLLSALTRSRSSPEGLPTAPPPSHTLIPASPHPPTVSTEEFLLIFQCSAYLSTVLWPFALSFTSLLLSMLSQNLLNSFIIHCYGIF